jgi:hypothetical protein
MGWDSNPRWRCRHAGFQDRCLQPLGHPSRSSRCLKETGGERTHSPHRRRAPPIRLGSWRQSPGDEIPGQEGSLSFQDTARSLSGSDNREPVPCRRREPSGVRRALQGCRGAGRAPFASPRGRRSCAPGPRGEQKSGPPGLVNLCRGQINLALRHCISLGLSRPPMPPGAPGLPVIVELDVAGHA